MQAMRLSFALLCAVLLAGGSAAFAQQFSGQNITLIVNYSAGGPSDIEARIIAKHLPKYVQGLSSLVVRNVAGAGGRIAVNQLGESSPRDRLNISFFTWNPLDQIVQDSALRVRYNDLKLVTGLQQVSLLYIRRDAPPGIGKPADIAKLQPFKAGGLGPTGHGVLRQRLALDLLGAKYETISGYKGLRDIDIAILQGDIHLSNNSLPGYITSAKPNLIDKGIAIPLLQYDYNRPGGVNGRSPALPDVPSFLEVYQEVWGKDAAPGGEKWQALQLISSIVDSMYRTVFMPPIAPAAALAEMRRAFDKLGSDPEFIADYEKVVRTKPHFIPGAEGERIIAALGSVPPSLVSFLREYMAKPQ